jgi:hypothetical protein
VRIRNYGKPIPIDEVGSDSLIAEPFPERQKLLEVTMTQV